MPLLLAKCIAPKERGICGKPCELGRMFCPTHLMAPAGQRGGWLSAFKRRMSMAPSPPGTQHPQIVDIYDASHVWSSSKSGKAYSSLWVGAKPPVDRSYPTIDMIVLCAREYQPPTFQHFTGPVARVAIADSAPSSDEIRRALAGGNAVAKALSDGKKVLVTCYAGINRSALVAALALQRVTKMNNDQIIALLRDKRHPDCLYNEHFREVLKKFAPDR